MSEWCLNFTLPSHICHRTGALWEHDKGLLSGGRGSPHSIWRDQSLHIWCGAEMERRPGHKGHSQQWQTCPSCASSQQVWPITWGATLPDSKAWYILQREWICGLVWDLCKGEGYILQDTIWVKEKKLLSSFMDVVFMMIHWFCSIFTDVEIQNQGLCVCLHLEQIQQECIVLISRKALFTIYRPTLMSYTVVCERGMMCIRQMGL